MQVPKVYTPVHMNTMAAIAPAQEEGHSRCSSCSHAVVQLVQRQCLERDCKQLAERACRMERFFSA